MTVIFINVWDFSTKHLIGITHILYIFMLLDTLGIIISLLLLMSTT